MNEVAGLVSKLTEFGPQPFDITERVARCLFPPFPTRLVRVAQDLLLRQAQFGLCQFSLGAPEFSLDEREFLLHFAQLVFARAEQPKILLKLVARRLELRFGNLEALLRVVVVLSARLERVPSLFRDVNAFVTSRSLINTILSRQSRLSRTRRRG